MRDDQEPDAPLAEVVRKALLQISTKDEDTAAMRLAESYAAAIDDAADKGEALDKLGPKLLAALVELGMTPKARAAAAKGGPTNADSGKRSSLDELRERRDRRARPHATTAVDPTA
jgi:hypothetical protein